jgi:hypothetical protein
MPTELIKSEEKKELPINTINGAKENIVRWTKSKLWLIAAAAIILVVIGTSYATLLPNGSVSLKELSLVTLLLGFCSYSMFFSMTNAGIKSAKKESVYLNAVTDYAAEKKTLLESRMENRANEFCKYYVEEDLIAARKNELIEAGIDYEEYKQKYLGKSAKEIMQIKDENLFDTAKQCIIAANEILPIDLTPNWFLTNKKKKISLLKKQRQKNKKLSREPISQDPDVAVKKKYISKIISVALSSVLICYVGVSLIQEPTWATFFLMCVRLLPIVLNGVSGYFYGYDHVVEDVITHINGQTEMIVLCRQYCDEHKEKGSL